MIVAFSTHERRLPYDGGATVFPPRRFFLSFKGSIFDSGALFSLSGLITRPTLDVALKGRYRANFKNGLKSRSFLSEIKRASRARARTRLELKLILFINFNL